MSVDTHELDGMIFLLHLHHFFQLSVMIWLLVIMAVMASIFFSVAFWRNGGQNLGGAMVEDDEKKELVHNICHSP